LTCRVLDLPAELLAGAQLSGLKALGLRIG